MARGQVVTHVMPVGQHPLKQFVVKGKKDSSYPQDCENRRRHYEDREGEGGRG